MSELTWHVELEGRQPVCGAVSGFSGEVHIHPNVPNGTIKSISAHMEWPMGETELVFLNGYQTWTYCPEYGKRHKQRGLNHVPGFLLRKFSFDRYGDYHFVDYPGKPGMFHGFSYCYFRQGKTFRLIASLNERPGYTIFFYDNGKLTLRRDCQGVIHPGGALAAFDLFFAEGTEQEVFDGWFAAMGCRPRTAGRLAGYTSWYNRYEDITGQTVLHDLEGCKKLLAPGDLFQIDDGWEPHVGDWLEPDISKFPGGMGALSEKIHQSGFLSGLWLAPFVCAENSELMKNHPDWLLRVDGKPWRCGCNWGGFCALDIDVPAVQDYLRQVFDRVLEEWDFDLVKLDFLYAAAPFGTGTESRAGRMYRAMELLRQWCGDKLILGCGVPVMPAFGLVDYCRIGCDVSLRWDDVWYMRFFHRERASTCHSISNTIFRRQLNGRAFGNDPDVFFLREDNLRLSPAQKEILAQVNALFGQVLLTSDDPAGYRETAKSRYSSLLHLRDAENVRVDADQGLSVRYALDGKEYEINIW